MEEKVEKIVAAETQYQQTVEQLTQVYDDIISDYRAQGYQDSAELYRELEDYEKELNQKARTNALDEQAKLEEICALKKKEVAEIFEQKHKEALDVIVREVFEFGDC